MLHAAKRRAKAADLPFSLTAPDILAVWPRNGRCPVLGTRFDRRSLHTSPSLDRIDPRAGYVPGNIAVISHRANTIKSDGTASEHRKIAQWMDAKLH